MMLKSLRNFNRFRSKGSVLELLTINLFFVFSCSTSVYVYS